MDNQTVYLVVADGKVEARFGTEIEAQEHCLYHQHQFPGKWSVVIDNTALDRLAEDSHTGEHVRMCPYCDEYNMPPEWAQLADECDALKAQVAKSVDVVRGIAEAKRFDRAIFADDQSFVDWAQSLTLHALAKHGR